MRIEIRSADDWVVVYRNGKKVYEGHSCPLHFGLEALGIPFDYKDLDGVMNEVTLQMPDGSDPFPEELR